MGLFGKVVVVPPEVLGVVVALVVGGVQPVEVGMCSQGDGVAEEWEVEVGIEVGFQLSGIFAYGPQFSGGVVVQGVALKLRSSWVAKTLSPALAHLLKPSSSPSARVFFIWKWRVWS